MHGCGREFRGKNCITLALNSFPIRQPTAFAAEKKIAGFSVVQIIIKVMGDNLKKALLLFGLLMTLAIPSGLWAQQAGYSQTNLVPNTAGVASTTDPQLLNPWGISFIPGSDFWIATGYRFHRLHFN